MTKEISPGCLRKKKKFFKMRLKYFALRGRGEVIRLALAVANVEYHDDGVDGPHMSREEMKVRCIGVCLKT